ncbi:adenosylcobinamide-GDP ribazoletransferase [Desulfovibrio sp. OttesenSCG-928-C06]|nr:adenosylcobinamide-GDP ribazoletransferase [Desulfovibrio sp. OttesenSCG-928-C06]
MENFFTHAARRTLLALSFLSRLVNGRAATRDDIVGSFIWYPLAGAILGAVAVLPFALGLAEGKPLLQGILYAAFMAWLTRALHWDGWADLFDALGSGRTGEGFQEVLKDSRLGAFGAVGLVFGIGTMAVAAGLCLEQGHWPALLWGVILGRCLVAPLAGTTSAGSWSTLGVLTCEGTGTASIVISTAAAIVSGLLCVGVWHTLAGLVLAGCGVLFLRRIAIREGGINGDFMGCAIIWGELAVLLTVAVL